MRMPGAQTPRLAAGFCWRPLPLAGCSLFDSDDATNDLNKDAAQYQERPIDQIYAAAWIQINKGNWDRPPPSSTKWTASIPIRSGPAGPS